MGLEIVGWREWVSLPSLGIARIKAKVDSGARTSTLHAYDIETYFDRGEEFVRFKVHYLQNNDNVFAESVARVVEHRIVKSSSGHESNRPVIDTQIHFLNQAWNLEITLVGREQMGFRMLIGREALRGRFLIDPNLSYVGGRLSKKKKH
ncbi:MAG TPA: RimK/LysX family protein [Pirellulaceae bacterium]|nr:RimK/LysX family protein [Pirellulaceae bacterium]HMO93262.1 RimK/LysX family protein [Pirellulaceae bacterium]HMP69127.1 RimK/LysX family protein [Pirellulaceae bacterium]